MNNNILNLDYNFDIRYTSDAIYVLTYTSIYGETICKFGKNGIFKRFYSIPNYSRQFKLNNNFSIREVNERKI